MSAPPPQNGINPRLFATALWIIVLFLVVYVLVIAQALLIPLVLALFIWFLVNVLASLFGAIRIGHWQPPRWLQFLLAGLAMGLTVYLLFLVITSNIVQVQQNASDYQTNINRLVHDTLGRFGVTEAPDLSALLGNLDFSTIMRRLAASVGSLVGNVGLILVYLLFLFLEQRYFRLKMRAIFPDTARRAEIQGLLHDIGADVRTYLGIKTLVSAVTGIGSWLIMKAVGLHFAEFWALLIFILNFIPNIGSLIATILPSLLALVQFDDTLTPFLITAIGLTSVQLAVGNLLEPNLMGKSLNISPLVVVLSLVIWGLIWGVSGMFLCVPIAVILMIVLYHFDNTRWVALILSRNGQVQRRRRGTGD